MLVLLAHSEKLTNKEKHQISAALLRFIIRFITPKNVKLAAELNRWLIQLLKLPINEVAEVTCTFNLNDKDWTLPLYLNSTFNHAKFKSMLSLYEMLYQSIIDSKAFINKDVSFEQVMTYVEHPNLPSLTKKLTGKLPKPKHRIHCPLHQLNRKLSFDSIIDNSKSDTVSPLYNHVYRY